MFEECRRRRRNADQLRVAAQAASFSGLALSEASWDHVPTDSAEGARGGGGTGSPGDSDDEEKAAQRAPAELASPNTMCPPQEVEIERLSQGLRRQASVSGDRGAAVGDAQALLRDDVSPGGAMPMDEARPERLFVRFCFLV